MRNQGITVTSVTQGSSYGDTLISRYSGVKIHQCGDLFEYNIYNKNPSLIMENINEMLLQSFNQRFINREYIIDWFKSTHWRNQYYGCFLHDVKVYFTMCMIDELFKQDILEERLLYIKDNLVYDYPIDNYQFSMIESVIKPTRIEDYSVSFNDWLSTDTVDNFVEVDYLVTDPGFGYKDNGEQYFVSQDVDDVITLSLIPKIHNICISDETVLLSRTCFVYHYFKGKICNLEIFTNDSVKKVKELYPEYYKLVCLDKNCKVAEKCINFIMGARKIENGYRGYRYYQIIMPITVSEIESQSINNISFVPNPEEIADLYNASVRALNDIDTNTRSPMLSKLYHLPGKIGLCPDDLDPNHTVLAGKGAGRNVPGTV